MSYRYDSMWPRYITVAERKSQARRAATRLRKKGLKIDPVSIEGRKIAKSFWGKAWCDHLESFSDYSNRLPRGRSYVRHDAVCHLEILPGKVKAKVAGNSIYNVVIEIKKLHDDTWQNVKNRCTGRIGSMLELLQGKFSSEVMAVVTDAKDGLFPMSDEISFKCSCPDWAVMCKHVAATLYGVGNRLDRSPELLFLLRGVDPEELLLSDLRLDPSTDSEPFIEDEDLEGIFGVEIDMGAGKSVEKKRAASGAMPREQSEYLIDESGLTVVTGAVIHALRNKHGLTQTQLANHLNVTGATISRWEKCRKPIHMRLRSRVELEALLKFGIE